MEATRLRISPRLRALMNYKKFSGEVPRLLILRSHYWLDGACESAAAALGWQFASVPTPMVGAQTREQSATLLDAIVHFRPDLIISINLAGMDVDGLWARFFADLQVPYVTWFVDNPRTIIMDRTTYASPTSMALTWDASYIPYLRQAGFPHVHWLPLAADITLFNAPPAEQTVHPPTFVGHSMVDFADTARKHVLSDPQLAHWGTDKFVRARVSRSLLCEGIGAVVGLDALENMNPEQRRHLEMFFFLESTRQLRHDSIAALHNSELTVRGDEGWRATTGRLGPPLNYSSELPAFYNACSVNLNFTSTQMPTAVNQRVFDCPAAGGFLLSDDQTDLRRLFDEDEFVSFDSIDDCAAKLELYNSEPKLRRPIIEKARRRILQEHTYSRRLKTMARWGMEAFVN